MINGIDVGSILMIALPLLIIQLGLDIFALYRLVKDKAKYLPKWAWALIIIFVNLIGPIIFLILGREKDWDA